MLEPILLELGALPETIPIGCKSGGVVCLNSNPAVAGIGEKQCVPRELRRKRKYRDSGDLHGLIVKFGKGNVEAVPWLRREPLTAKTAEGI